MDPQTAKLQGFNRVTAVTMNKTSEEDRWMTEDMLGGPQELNNPTRARLIVESGKLTSRPSKFAALATIGVV
eukprot:7113922-Pyramimonas_sp.AAC.1